MCSEKLVKYSEGLKNKIQIFPKIYIIGKDHLRLKKYLLLSRSTIATLLINL